MSRFGFCYCFEDLKKYIQMNHDLYTHSLVYYDYVIIEVYHDRIRFFVDSIVCIFLNVRVAA